MEEFRIEIEDWTGSGFGPPEEVATRGMLRIVAGGTCLTRHESAWSQSISERVHVSMYPLALWIAANWWRLAYEAPRTQDHDAYDWRAAHELPAAGRGYLWPPIRFRPDGEVVWIEARPTGAEVREPLRYLEPGGKAISTADFERACTRFVDTVIARLHAVGLPSTALERTWQEVCAERTESASNLDRRFEALLHCDPDQADPDAIAALRQLAAEAGSQAALELTGALSAPAIGAQLAALRSASQSPSCLRSSWSDAGLASKLANDWTGLCDHRAPPWRRGMQAAQRLRQAWGLTAQPVATSLLESRLGLPVDALTSSAASNDVPVGLVVVRPGEVSWLLRAKRLTGRRFEAVRALGDLLVHSSPDTWHPITDLHTARQQFQRAFAAEVLCPIEPLQDFLRDGVAEDSIADAADHFGVSERTVEHQLENSARRSPYGTGSPNSDPNR